MIRAATGRPTADTGLNSEPVIRPSSAGGKLQSYAYVNLQDEARPVTCATVPRNASLIVLPTTPPTRESKKGVSFPPQLIMDRRLTLHNVDGIGNDAKTLTRLNTPTSSMAKIKIEERITLEQLHKIKIAFEEADTDGSGTLDIDEFKTVVKSCLGVKGRNEEQIVALFMKIDSSSDGEIDWDEFCTYMQLEYAEKEDALKRAKRIRFTLPALSSPTPHHKAPILRVVCISDTSYMCAGQDGLFTFWTPDLKLRRTKSILDIPMAERQSFTSKPSVWVTDVAVLSAHGKLLVGTGEREFQFYELLTFEFYCQVIGLDTVPLTIDLCSMEKDGCLIVYGDDQGCISIMMFDGIGDTLKAWKKLPKVNGVPTVTMYDVAGGEGTSFIKWKVHNDWVTEVRYFHELRSVISSSNDAATGLVRGCTTASTILDHLHAHPPSNTPPNPPSTQPQPPKPEKLRKNVTMVPQRRQKSDQSVFYVYKGVKTFDFCSTTNIMASGGMDRIVRLWNPYVPQKATGHLRGHGSPIVFLSIAGEDKRLFSVSADKCLKVWDLVEQNCLVSLNPKLHKVVGELLACVYSPQGKAIAMATDQLSLLKISQKEGSRSAPGLASRMKQAVIAGDMPISHTEAVTCCAYNKNFGHVITCSESSVVKLWDFETGTFMFEFSSAHGDSSITSLTFDASGRRLITAGRDGAVKIWNYNNGHCLRSLEREADCREVTNCIYVEMNNNKFIVAVGWDHRVNIFPDQSDYFHLVQRPYPHWPDDLKSGHAEDIVAVAYGKPNMLATVSYEGLIIVWNIVSGHSISKISFPHDSLTSRDNSDNEEDFPAMNDEASRKAVNKLLFLPDRPHGKEVAALVAGCSDGSVIFWNVHLRIAHARFLVMKRSRTLSAMKVSEDGSKLFVANDIGYVTMWDIGDYAIFPMGDLADDCTCPRSSPPPKRVAIWRAHVQSITWLELVESYDVLLTSSVDFTVRVWTMSGHYIGAFGQPKPWDIFDPSTWQHPMVPPEVLLDPLSLPDHPILDEKKTAMEIIHAESLEPSDSEGEDEIRDELTDELETKKSGVVVKAPPRQPSKSSGWGAGLSEEAWKRKLSRRLSRSSLVTNLGFLKDEDEQMLNDVRATMRKSSGKRLRHEKLMQRTLRTSHDVSSRAFKSLQYFELGDPPEDVTKPNPRAHIDDVFLNENDEIEA